MTSAIKTISLILFSSLSLLASPPSATYYVNVDAGSDSNNGTATNSAWAHLPASTNVTGAGWAQIMDGNVIYVKGGTTNTVALYVSPTGTNFNGAAAYDSIKIVSGDQISWGTGKAIYDMGTNATSAFWIQSGTGITVDGFEVRNIKAGGVGPGFDTSTGSSGFPIGSGSSYIKVRRCYIHDCFRSTDDTGHGIETQSPSHHLIFECNTIGPRIGTKGIEPSQGSAWVIIRSNLVVNSGDHNIAVSANRCDVNNNLVICQGPYAHDPIYGIKNTGFSNDFWNNIIYENPTSPLSATGFGFSEPVDANGGGYNRFINNTVYHLQSPGSYGSAGVGLVYGISAQVISNCTAANNLLLQSTNFQGAIQLFFQSNSVSADVNHNDLWGGGATLVANYGPQSAPPAVTVSSLESSINGGNGTASGNVNLDPKITGGTLPTSLDATSFLPNTTFFALSATSPSSVTNTGNIILGDASHGYSASPTKFAFDILGLPRTIWSMGAYEFGASVILPPTGLMVVQRATAGTLIVPKMPVPDDALPSGIAFRWKASTLADGAVNLWTDSLTGNNLFQSSGGNQPTKDANGVTFATGKWFDSTNVTLRCASGVDALDTFLVICNLDSTAEGYLLGVGNNSWMGVSGSTQWFNPNGPWGTPVTGQWVDLVYAGWDGANYNSYTNGVIGNSGPAGSLYNSTVQYVGRVTGGGYFKGKVQEVIVWTNVVGFTSLQVSNIHWYSTNTYAYTP